MHYIFVAVFHFDKIPLWGALLASIGIGLLVSILVQFLLVPYQRKAILKSLGNFKNKFINSLWHISQYN